jgi:hypothetical protein
MGLITETERLARTITLVAGANGLVMIDEYNKSSALRLPSYRQATASDYIVLASGGKCSSVLPLGNGTQFPLADKWVLSKRKSQVKARRTLTMQIKQLQQLKISFC